MNTLWLLKMYTSPIHGTFLSRDLELSSMAAIFELDLLCQGEYLISVQPFTAAAAAATVI